ncbi:MAG: tRNA (adenosine(37)-N6)-dimethylallyltransferase MiaA [Clostridiaceae bacterium]
MKNNIIIIAGPTGVGKTEISLKLAERINGEIVSADSMQIYQFMDIGSAKSSLEERARVPHHMIDIVSPFDSFTVSQYKNLAEKCIDDILKRGKVPIMVGGTGLYIDAVVKNMSFTEGGTDEAYRLELENLANEKGNEHVHDLLKTVDPLSASRIHPNNLKKVIRALEVYKITKKPFSDFKDTDEVNPKYRISYFYLNKNRESLYNDIDQRVDNMVKSGLLEEVKMLREKGLDKSFVSMQGIGYKEILSALEDQMTFDEAISLIKKRSRNYAKRQLTWFRHSPYAIELNKDELSEDEIMNILEINANNVEI